MLYLSHEFDFTEDQMETIAVIINTHAKNSIKAKDYCKGLRKASIPYKLYKTKADNLDSILKSCVKKYRLILIGGGDGTIRTAAHYCAHKSIILAVLPLGTLNHFSKELDLPSSVEELIESLTYRHSDSIDLAEVNDMIFINNSSFGFYPKFAEQRDLYSKTINKWLSYIPSLIDSFRKHKAYKLTVKSRYLNFPLYTSFLMISNNLYSYEFPLKVQRDNFQKSLLGLYFFKQGKIRLFKLFKNWFNKQASFEKHHSKYPIELHFKNQNEITISLDGDTVKTHTPLIYKILPKSLNILKKPPCV